jgi:hypothetical protein
MEVVVAHKPLHRVQVQLTKKNTGVKFGDEGDMILALFYMMM